jgi:hypothetical protein
VLHTRLSPDLVARAFGVHNCALCLETLAGPPVDQTGGALVSVICALNVCGFCFWLLDCLYVLGFSSSQSDCVKFVEDTSKMKTVI